MKITNDLIGQVFNSLTVVEIVYVPHRKGNWIRCKCVCGKLTVLLQYNQLVNGIVKTCGCSRSWKACYKTHGMSLTAEHSTWCRMKNRCYNPNYYQFHRYGGRGVSICKRWLNSFENFFEDMGVRPSNAHSLDRINNDAGGYCKENCRWSTQKEQQRNKSSNRLVEIDGVVKCVTEWADIYNMRSDLIYQRISRGWDEKKAIITPVST